MGILELLIIAVALAMDAFAVAVCAGLTMKRFRLKPALVIGAYFGVFQAAMPLAGYFLASRFAEGLSAIDHWVAFGLLCFIGGKMAYNGFTDKNSGETDEPFSLNHRHILTLAVATSIDALAVGVSFAFLHIEKIAPSVLVIGAVTFLLSAAGVKIGSVFGSKFKSKAEIAGGVALILIGLNILLGH
jgi:putative Mn2+ efflux pump MntP